MGSTVLGLCVLAEVRLAAVKENDFICFALDEATRR
jgi:hypothetical protein